MTKHQGEITPRGAAKLIGCDIRTVRRWCRDVLNGQRSRITQCRRDALGRYFLNRTEVREIAGQAEVVT